MTAVLRKSLQLFRNIFSHDRPFCSQPACHFVWTALPAVFSEVYLHLYYVSVFVCTVSVSGVCGGGVHVCTQCVSLCVCLFKLIKDPVMYSMWLHDTLLCTFVISTLVASLHSQHAL